MVALEIVGREQQQCHEAWYREASALVLQVEITRQLHEMFACTPNKKYEPQTLSNSLSQIRCFLQLKPRRTRRLSIRRNPTLKVFPKILTTSSNSRSTRAIRLRSPPAATSLAPSLAPSRPPSRKLRRRRRRQRRSPKLHLRLPQAAMLMSLTTRPPPSLP